MTTQVTIMQIADLYIRVSTDEQADTGYSQRHQEEILRRWCEMNNVHIRRVYFEDHSAKSFERPKFRQYLLELRKEKSKAPALLLFTKWDRFSRNATDAYLMIRTLRKLSVEPQAIEQPLNLTIPENKMMLAFYLAAPEVENDRRSLNVAAGMRRAKKEGRFMGKAQIGYKNRKDEKRKWIEPDPQLAPVVKEIFEDVALGKYSAESILKFTRAKGVKCSKNNFWNILRNPVYCGKIYVPPAGTDPGGYVTGQHQPIISEALFYQVQAVLDGRKKAQRSKKVTDDRFPLRGHLLCPSQDCGRLLTASTSKGRSKYYEYYHCISACGTRFPAAAPNGAIITELQKWKPHPAVNHLLTHILQDVHNQSRQGQQQQLKEIKRELAILKDRHVKARELLLAGHLPPDDYSAIRSECDAAMAILENKAAEMAAPPADITADMEKSISILSHLDEWYTTSGVSEKKQIVDSIFTAPLVYDGTGFRTAPVNEAVQLIYNLGAAFEGIKKGQESEIGALSHEVIPIAPFSNRFIADLRKLSSLYSLLKAG